jgi:hypothetical protein
MAFRQAGGNQPGSLPQVVKRQHPIVKTDCQVGNLKLVEPRPGQSFQVMAEVVAKDTSGAALEWRKVLNPFRSVSGHSLGQHGKRIRILLAPGFTR